MEEEAPTFLEFQFPVFFYFRRRFFTDGENHYFSQQYQAICLRFTKNENGGSLVLIEVRSDQFCHGCARVLTKIPTPMILKTENVRFMQRNLSDKILLTIAVVCQAHVQSVSALRVKTRFQENQNTLIFFHDGILILLGWVSSVVCPSSILNMGLFLNALS